jgi:uncharacterized coiled-coil DUF342 family protein
MHLERVTTRSSEAGVAGWIASNDVTLFTMIVVMAVAIFLHSRVNKGVLAQAELANQNAAISQTLASTATELDSARNLLEKTNDRLALTQEERDELRRQLVEKLAAMSEINAKLEALIADKGELARQQRTLLSEKEALEKDRDSASAANASLRTDLDQLAAQLADKVAALSDIESQRDQLTKQAAELNSLVTSLKRRLEEMNIDLQTARDEAVAARAATDAKTQELQAKLAAGDRQAEAYLADLRRATEMLESLKLEKRQLQSELTAAERKRQADLLAEAENNRELVGLKGSLHKVAIIVDASGSMRQTGADGADRWTEAQAIAATWLKHLNVQQCALIVYSTDVRTFPADGSLIDLRGEAGAANRDQLLQRLQAIQPGGWTDTLAAFQKAYEYDVDTILLLSDGAPSKVASGIYQDALAQQIYQLCREHPGIPVNAIGLGNYFDQEMSTFLRTVANLTGGSFRGE